MPNQTENNFSLNTWKPNQWAHLPGTAVPTVTLPDGTVAEGVAMLAYGWDASTQTFQKQPSAAKTLLTAPINLSATGTVVAAVSTKRIKVYSIVLICSAALGVKFRDGGSTDLEGQQSIAATSGRVETVDPPNFILATSAGNSLDLVIAGTGNVGGRVSYWTDDTV